MVLELRRMGEPVVMCVLCTSPVNEFESRRNQLLRPVSAPSSDGSDAERLFACASTSVVSAVMRPTSVGSEEESRFE